MIKSFADRETQALYATGKTKRLPPDIQKRAARKLEYLDLAVRLQDLQVPPGNRLHLLSGDRQGQHSPSRLTTNGGFAFVSTMEMPMTLKSAMTTEKGENHEHREHWYQTQAHPSRGDPA